MEFESANIDILEDFEAGWRWVVRMHAINGAGRAVGGATVVFIVSLGVVVVNSITIANNGGQECNTLHIWRNVTLCLAALSIIIVAGAVLFTACTCSWKVPLKLQGDVVYHASMRNAAGAVAITTNPRPVLFSFGSLVLSVVQWVIFIVVYGVSVNTGPSKLCTITESGTQFVQIIASAAGLLFSAAVLLAKADGKDRSLMDTILAEYKPLKVSEIMDAYPALLVMALTDCTKFVKAGHCTYASNVVGEGVVLDYLLRAKHLHVEVKTGSANIQLKDAMVAFRGERGMRVEVAKYGVLRLGAEPQPVAQTVHSDTNNDDAIMGECKEWIIG